MASIINISEDPKGAIERLLYDQDRAMRAVMQAHEDKPITKPTKNAYLLLNTAIDHSQSHDFGRDVGIDCIG